MNRMILFALILTSSVSRAECANNLLPETSADAALAPLHARSRFVHVRRSVAAAMLIAGFAGPAFAISNEEWKNAPGAEIVAKGNRTMVYRFVDEIDGKKMLCYFVESYYTGDAGKGGITCVPKP